MNPNEIHPIRNNAALGLTLPYQKFAANGFGQLALGIKMESQILNTKPYTLNPKA